jgi:hypothetical protein
MADEKSGKSMSNLEEVCKSESGAVYVGRRERKDKRTISPLDKSHPTTTSTPSFFKNSSISFSRSTFAPFSQLFGSRTNGESVGKAVKATRGFRDWIWGVAAVVLFSSATHPINSMQRLRENLCERVRENNTGRAYDE